AFMSEAVKVPAQIVSPWLHEGQITLIHADAGVGKTWCALTIALLAASGREAMGFTGAGVPVLYVDGEMSQHDLRARVALLEGTLGITADDPTRSRFHLWAQALMTKDGPPVFLDL